MDGAPSEPPSRLERARLDIVHLRLEEADDLWRAIDSALRVSARTLEVARVGVWILTADRDELYRARLHDVNGNGGSAASTDDALLPLARWPRYREAVVSRRVVVASDARNDPATSELRAEYLDPVGITSMLDVPLFLTGTVHGIVCHEHVGPARTWTPREVDFAISVADMLTALLEQAIRLSAERRLRTVDSEQVAVAARTAAGIAHDVNTVLQAISANAAAAGSTRIEALRGEAVTRILEDCRRSARILGEIQDLGAVHERITVEVGLEEVIEGLRPTLEALVGTARSVRVVVDHARIFVPATRTDIERIVLNLVTNARDASDAGAITIAVRTSEGRAAIEVDDEGPGVDPRHAEDVFDPGFSTKHEPQGGLGLFIVKVIAERSGGSVLVTSAGGRGARFAVSWPHHSQPT